MPLVRSQKTKAGNATASWSWVSVGVFRISATLSCPMKLHKYPLDTQTCPMMFESCEFSQTRAHIPTVIAPLDVPLKLCPISDRRCWHTLCKAEGIDGSLIVSIVSAFRLVPICCLCVCVATFRVYLQQFGWNLTEESIPSKVFVIVWKLGDQW